MATTITTKAFCEMIIKLAALTGEGAENSFHFEVNVNNEDNLVLSLETMDGRVASSIGSTSTSMGVLLASLAIEVAEVAEDSLSDKEDEVRTNLREELSQMLDVDEFCAGENIYDWKSELNSLSTAIRDLQRGFQDDGLESLDQMRELTNELREVAAEFAV